jgi:predicted enzyme related to lactoylglutathione lyase
VGEQYVIETATSVKTVFNKFGCLYLPVDDGEAICKWYVKHFNSAGTRKLDLFWEKTKETGLTSNFMTDEWIPGESYEMFAVRFETDSIEELYVRLSAANVKLEPLRDVDNKGLMFVYTDPQGNKFQVWQHPDTVTQPLRDDVPALIGVAALFFPVSDREATHKWYTEFLGVDVSVSGQPMTREGEEFYFCRSLEPGRTLNFYTGAGDIQNMSIVNISVDGLEDMHRRMVNHGQVVQEQILDREGCGRQFHLFDPDGNRLEIWEVQTFVWRNDAGVNSPNWKERFGFGNCYFHGDVDAFLTKVAEDEDGGSRRIKIHANLHEFDPEGLKKLLGAFEQFSRQYPEKAFQIVYGEWEW